MSFNTIRINISSIATSSLHNKNFGSGATTLILLNEDTNDIMKIVKSLEESDLLKKKH